MSVVRHQSNETDFLLTMNFILFRNQGYPLQNSSLGQLHSDGCVVSTVRSSAGRLLLVYLLARWLRSSGYYPKYQNGALSSGFWARGIKRSHRDWDSANRWGLRNHRNAFLCHKFIDRNCRMTRGVIVVQHAIACNAWSHTCHPFQGFPDEKFDSLSWLHKFLVDDPLTVKKTNEHRFHFGFAHSRFPGTGRVCSVPLPTLAFCLRVVLQNPWFITCNNATEEFWLSQGGPEDQDTHPSDWPSAQSWGSLEPSWRTLFSCPNPVLKFLDGKPVQI